MESYEALDRIDRKKRTKSTFRPGSNCDDLVKNWTEAFNKKWKGDLSSKVIETIELRDEKTIEYITVFNGHSRYGMSTSNHAWVVDVQSKVRFCGL
ncbi:hypothetical protein LIER_09433 [Lithospermum erythrorhizon]|uniref:Uncharacterized protein n=1 Tax=Lithospermum erythrorhizon TaxID=34254 RepID=A0AAV3PHL8_LITER